MHSCSQIEIASQANSFGILCFLLKNSGLLNEKNYTFILNTKNMDTVILPKAIMPS